jgi:hypothetical protein
MMDQELFFTSPVVGFFTLRDMAIMIGVPLHRVQAAVAELRISHARRHGIVRLFTAGDYRDIATQIAKSVNPRDAQPSQ